MACGAAEKYLANYAFGFRVEFVEIIGVCGTKIGSGAVCKQSH
jgi:hypothetical protein